MRQITLIPGDGIGPEITTVVRDIFFALDIDIEWDIVNAGKKVMEKEQTPLPPEVITSLKKNKIGLKGPITTPVGSGFRSVNVALRKKLNLYANVRPIKNLPGINTRYDDIDLIIIRENTEGLYSGIEHMAGADAAESIRLITREGSERIARFAFEYALREGRSRVTAVHKANILKLSDGLFLESVRKIASDYSNIDYNERIVDNMCMQLVQYPDDYDVLVLPNLFGDIVSDLAAGLIGGLGVTPGANIGKDIALFEAVHGSAPDIAGQGIANPLAIIRSAIMMLNYLDEKQAATRLDIAIAKTLASDQKETILTPDLGGKGNTKTLTEKILENL